MFERFSRGYYLGRLYVEPHDGAQAAIARDQHERVNEQLYASNGGVERTDLPLVMKLESTHFAVGGDADVPADTLAVPRSLIEETRIRNPPTLREVFLAKADRARQLLPVAEGTADVREAVDRATPDWRDDLPAFRLSDAARPEDEREDGNGGWDGDEGQDGPGGADGSGFGGFDGPDGPAGI